MATSSRDIRCPKARQWLRSCASARTKARECAISIPRSGQDQSGQTTPVGPDLTGPEKKGLCNAFFAGNGNEENGKTDSSSVAFKNLQDAADKAGQSVKDFCAEVLLPQTTTSSPAGHGKSHGKGKAKGHDKSGGNGQESGHSSNGHGHSGSHGSSWA